MLAWLSRVTESTAVQIVVGFLVPYVVGAWAPALRAPISLTVLAWAVVGAAVALAALVVGYARLRLGEARVCTYCHGVIRGRWVKVPHALAESAHPRCYKHGMANS